VCHGGSHFDVIRIMKDCVHIVCKEFVMYVVSGVPGCISYLMQPTIK
jgi:hypothetical protein